MFTFSIPNPAWPTTPPLWSDLQPHAARLLHSPPNRSSDTDVCLALPLPKSVLYAGKGRLSPVSLVYSPPARNLNRGCSPSCFGELLSCCSCLSSQRHPPRPLAHHASCLSRSSGSQTCSSLCRASCSFSIHTVLRHSIRVKISRQMSAGI